MAGLAGAPTAVDEQIPETQRVALDALTAGPCCCAATCSNVDATPQLGAALQGLLAQVLTLTTARRSPLDVLLFLEVRARPSQAPPELPCLAGWAGCPRPRAGQGPGPLTRRRGPTDGAPQQVWHAVLSYLDSFENALWDAGDDATAQQQVKNAVEGYKGEAARHVSCHPEARCQLGRPVG